MSVFSETLSTIGYLLSKVEPDIWINYMKDHYSYIFTYCYNLLICDKYPGAVLEGFLLVYILEGISVPE